MTEKEESRRAAKDLVGDYADWFASPDRDAGWHSYPILAKMIDFEGELPGSSGFYGVDAVFKEQKYLAPYLSHRTRRAIRIMHELRDHKINHYVALLFDVMYRGRVKNAIDPFHPDKPISIPYTDERIATGLRITVPTFRQWISRGYLFVEHQMDHKKAA